MTNTSVIKKDFYTEQTQQFQDRAKAASSTFRYNTPYSNLAYEDTNNSHRTEEASKILPCDLDETDLDVIFKYLETKLGNKTSQLKKEVQELVMNQTR